MLDLGYKDWIMRNVPLRAGKDWWLYPSSLNVRDMSVAQEMLVDLDPRGVAARLGMSEIDVRQILNKPIVQAMFQALQGARSLRTQIHADEVLRCWELARRSDTNEVVQVRVGCCRYCWGDGHMYQRTMGEMEKDLLQHERNNAKLPESERRMFDAKGGDGFDRRRDPNPECPECVGEGHPRVVVADTTKLAPGARYRYEGVELYPDGSLKKVVLRGRHEFDQMVGQHLGIIGKGGRAAARDPEDMTNEELEAILLRHGRVVDVEFEEVGDGDVARSEDPVGG